MNDQRLFHRYPTAVRVAFRVRGASHRGVLSNVSAGGGFVASEALPPRGERVQMAAHAESGKSSIWLDLRVTWVNEQASPEFPERGFGGYWVHACSRDSEDQIREFLACVVGVTRPIIRPVSPPAGGDVVYMYRFPEVYDGSAVEELPWSEGRTVDREIPDTRSRDTSDPAWLAADASPDPDAGPEPLPDALSIAELTSAAQTVPPRTVSTTAEILVDDDIVPRRTGTGSGDASGFRNLLKKLSGVRVRSSKDAPAGAAPPAVAIPSSDLGLQYRVGRKSFPGRISRLGTGWLVFDTAADVPALWTRIVVVVPLEVAKKAREVEIHAQVTRIKQLGGNAAVNCKIIRIDEKGQAGAWGQYVEAFAQRSPGAS